jgi:putative Holliday junction resolvase
MDFGTRRIGLAVSDPERRIASPLAVYERCNPIQDAQRLRELIEAEEIAAVVLGLPLHTSGREGQKAQEARAFGKWLQQETGLPMTFWDERFTTIEAEGYLNAAGLTEKRRQARRDMLAAQILLQSYLDAGCPPFPEVGPLTDTE